MRRGYLDRARYLGDPDFVKNAARAADVEGVREDARGVDRSEARVEQRGARQGHRHAGRVHGARRDDAVLDRRQATATPCRTRSRSRAGSARTSSSTAPDSSSTTRWATSTRSRARRISRGDIGTPANLIAPGKRMLSSMSPTIVTKNGKLFMVTGSPGGRTIINTVMEIVLNAHRLRHGRAPGGRRAALPSPVAAGRGDVRAQRASRLDGAAAAGDGPHGQVRRPAGRRPHDHHHATAWPTARTTERSADSKASALSVRREPRLELALLHLLEQLLRFVVLVVRRTTRDVERRIVGAVLVAFRLCALATVFLTSLASCFSSMTDSVEG